jgi:glutaredoxin-like protein
MSSGSEGLVEWRDTKSELLTVKDEDVSYARQLLGSEIKREVRVELFLSERDCRYCGRAEELLKEIASFSPLIKLELRLLEADMDRASELGVDQAPTTVVHANNGTKLYYQGLPSGNQFRVIAEDIVDASLGATNMSEFARIAVLSVQRPMTVDVFVTPTCPYSPIAVRAAHRLAMENPNVRARMIEIVEFPDLALKYNVMGVPKILIDDKIHFDGTLAEEALAEVLQAAAR